MIYYSVAEINLGLLGTYLVEVRNEGMGCCCAVFGSLTAAISVPGTVFTDEAASVLDNVWLRRGNNTLQRRLTEVASSALSRQPKMIIPGISLETQPDRVTFFVSVG